MSDPIKAITDDGIIPPWAVCEEPANDLWFKGRTIHGHGKRVADVASMSPEIERTVANLIAAAPDLFSVVENLVIAHDDYAKQMGHLDFDDPLSDVVAHARAALSKARGQS